MSDAISNAEIDRIRRHSREIVRCLGFLNKGLAGTDLAPSAVHAIVEIGLGNAVNATELGALLGLEKSTVSRLVGGLRKSGILAVEPDERDARARMLRLTGAGQARFREIEEYARAQVRNALSPAAPAARETIESGLSQYADALTRAAGTERQEPEVSQQLVFGEGYVPALLGRVTEMHASYYSRHYGFGSIFERRVASEMAEFLGRIGHPANGTFHVRLHDRVVGAVSVDGEDLGGGAAHLRWFILGDEARGQGAGRLLLKRAVEHADRHGFAETRLWTFQGLDAARHLYEDAGFVLAEEKPGEQWGTRVVEQMFVRPRGTS